MRDHSNDFIRDPLFDTLRTANSGMEQTLIHRRHGRSAPLAFRGERGIRRGGPTSIAPTEETGMRA